MTYENMMARLALANVISVGINNALLGLIVSNDKPSIETIKKLMDEQGDIAEAARDIYARYQEYTKDRS